MQVDELGFKRWQKEVMEELRRISLAVRGTEDQPDAGLLSRMREMEKKDNEQDARLTGIEEKQKEIRHLLESDKSQDQRLAEVERWKDQTIAFQKAERESQKKQRGWREAAMWAVRMAISLGTLAIGAKLWLTGV